MQPCLDLGGQGIHEIGDDDDCGDGGEHRVEKFEVIGFYGLPHVGAGYLFQEKIVTAFADRHEDGKEEDHDDDPFGKGYIGDDGTGLYPEDESDGEDEDVEDGDLFEAEAITEIEEKIEGEYECEIGADGPGDPETENDEQGADEKGSAGGDGAGGQGAFTFHRVFPVIFPVAVIVDDIDRAGDEGECDEAEEEGDQLRPVENVACEI